MIVSVVYSITLESFKTLPNTVIPNIISMMTNITYSLNVT